MNKLSWLLYWADTLPSLSAATGITSFVVVLACSIMFVLRIMWKTDEPEEYEKAGRPLDIIKWLTPVAFLGLLLSSLVPEKDTFYMIAASEVGEEALQAPEVGKVRKVINNWLDEQVKTENKETAQ